MAVPAAGAAAADEPDPLTTHAEDALLETGSLVALAARLQEVCTRHGWTLSTAESCTGGLVGHAVTDVPGSSGYYLGGVVTYDDAQKRRLLGVTEQALRSHGAVSAQVAVAMAVGARASFGSTLAVSVTGIAGPDGGTPQKPVGLVYVALADAQGHDVRRFVWDGDRHQIKLRSAEAALRLLLERTEGSATAEASGRPA